MRLTPQQQSAIRTAVAETFGEDATIWLFGSRVDDNKRGGDIDLLIETKVLDVTTIVRSELAFLTKLQMKLGEQRIDVLVDYPSRQYTTPIFAIAKQLGVRL